VTLTENLLACFFFFFFFFFADSSDTKPTATHPVSASHKIPGVFCCSEMDPDMQ
jgi:hypothetical protein